jgi:hypothetical protein
MLLVSFRLWVRLSASIEREISEVNPACTTGGGNHSEPHGIVKKALFSNLDLLPIQKPFNNLRILLRPFAHTQLLGYYVALAVKSH